jgi:predicted phage terminase large subunit-like protein
MTIPELRTALKRNFEAFLLKAHGERLDDPYIPYLANELAKVARCEIKRLIVNLPPRHLKTFATSKCLPAFILGRDPNAKIMIITYGENLAVEIADGVRSILRTPWYQATFSTRISRDHARVSDFATTAGGSVYAAPIGGQLTGYGADYIIVDDPLEIRDAENTARIEFVNHRFDNVIRNRLNRPSRGVIVIAAHRLHENDLCGHVLADGDEWTTVLLPFEATRSAEFDLAHGKKWRRKKGDLLREHEFSERDLRRLRKLHNFNALYQQNPGGTALPKILQKHFVLQPLLDNESESIPTVISIDPGQAEGDGNSYSVVQAWRVRSGSYFLADQWRGRETYGKLRSMCRQMIRRHRPGVVLIERAGIGAALLSDLQQFGWTERIPIVPRESKITRLRSYIKVILDKKIALPESAEWRQDYVAEFMEFPHSKFSDQVDATTQFLEFMATNPTLKMPKRPGMGALALNSRTQRMVNIKGAAIALGSRRFR